MLKRALLCVLCLSFNTSFLMAADAPEGGAAVQNDYRYFQLEPDIITNYVKPGKRIGFVRLTIELMVKSSGDYDLIDKHEPLIRDKIISILGQQNEKMIKSTEERDAIRLNCLEQVNNLLYAETGEKPLANLLFTKYLYQ